ncbi:unnamed protein product [Ambrosiozyma monospora]|uniref:Unnamed protein product n=1 Tax=Ambrosiozyma monospora TaxID=43982 RepID=A0A9W6T3Q4_AMBMO|nr:unnamed protein product [Ambrosiozyma monospora]
MESIYIKPTSVTSTLPSKSYFIRNSNLLWAKVKKVSGGSTSSDGFSFSTASNNSYSNHASSSTSSVSYSSSLTAALKQPSSRLSGSSYPGNVAHGGGNGSDSHNGSVRFTKKDINMNDTKNNILKELGSNGELLMGFDNSIEVYDWLPHSSLRKQSIGSSSVHLSHSGSNVSSGGSGGGLSSIESVSLHLVAKMDNIAENGKLLRLHL